MSLWKDWASGKDLSGVDKVEIRSERINAIGAIASLIYYGINLFSFDGDERTKKSGIGFIEGHVGVPEVDKKLDLTYVSNKFKNFYNYHEMLISFSIFYIPRLFERKGTIRGLADFVKEKDNKKMILRKAFMEAEEYLLELFQNEEVK